MLPSDQWLSFLCINLAFAGAALSVGFFAGAWFLGGRREERETESVESSRQVLDRQHTVAKSEQLRDLAIGVVSDIGEHSTRVREITANLQSLDLNDIEATGAGLVAAMAEIISANNNLQHQLAAAEDQIRTQAEEIRGYEIESRTDSLTGLANRRAFDDELARRFSEWQRKGTVFSLLLLDLDHFKRFNDTYGHQLGDEVLRRAGQELKATCRGMDLPCRYGGEEFAVVLPSTPARDAGASAERFRKVIEAMSIEVDGQQLTVTCSIGVAQIGQADDIVRILKRADEALYQSKAAGRNCCHLHDGQVPVPVGAVKSAPKPQQPAPANPRIATHVLDNLKNRTRFVEDLRRQMSQAQRSGDPLAVLTAKLDNYASIKRNAGQGALLTALEAMAQRLQSTLREQDILARLSDQTFVVMMPATTPEEGALAGEHIDQLLRDVQVEGPQGKVDLQIGLGLGRLEEVDSIESLIRRAETECLSSKMEPSLVGEGR